MHKREIQISVAGGTHARALSLIIKTRLIALREVNMWISNQTAKNGADECLGWVGPVDSMEEREFCIINGILCLHNNLFMVHLACKYVNCWGENEEN